MDAQAPLRAVVFDVGETLVDETSQWASWAERLGVTTLTLFAVLGAVIDRGHDHREFLQVLRPGADFEAERAAMDAAGGPVPAQLYPDVRACLQAVRDAGLTVVVGGNQPAAFQRLVEQLDLPVDVVTSSGSRGVDKPDPAFFQAVAGLAGVGPDECVHVGDRLDNDVVPAVAAGMRAVWLRRGPWAALQAGRLGGGGAHAVIDSLSALPALLARW